MKNNFKNIKKDLRIFKKTPNGVENKEEATA